MGSSGRAGGSPNVKRVGGVGDGVRLHEREEALKGEPQERIQYEIRLGGTKRSKTSRG